MFFGDGDDMMAGLMFGSGWFGLFLCIVLGGIAAPILADAGRRRADGRGWGVQGVIGFGMVGVGLVAALSSWGTFFGVMGIPFAAITGINAWRAFGAAARRREREEEQIRHAARMGEAFRGPAADPASSTPPTPAPRQAQAPSWYPGDDAGRDDAGTGRDGGTDPGRPRS